MPPPPAESSHAGRTISVAPAASIGKAQDDGIAGVVEDARGKPVAGATVDILAPRPPRPPIDIVAMIRDLAVARTVAASTKTTADGRFETAALPPGTYPVVARKAGHAAAVTSVTVPATSAQPVRLALAAGHRVEGTVLRRDGSVAAGVSVVAFSLGSGLDLDPPGKPMVRTDSKGQFVFDTLPGGTWSFIAAPPNEGYSHAVERDVRSSEPLVLELDGRGTLSGRVADEEDAPIAGARVVAGFARGFGIDLEYGGSTTTDSEGRYELRGLSTASVELFFVQADGYCPHRGRVHQGEESRRMDVTLVRGGTVRGTVFAEGTKLPVGGATISVVSAATMIGGVHGVTSAADGKFELRGVPIGRSLLLVSKAGWRQTDPADPRSLLPRGGPREIESSDATDPGTGATVVVTRSGQALERDLEMLHPVPIRGRVLDPDGNAVPGAQVTAVREGESPDRASKFEHFLGTGEQRPLSDAQGRFEIASPVLKGRVLVEVSALDRRLRSSVVVDVDPEKPAPDINVRLGTGTSIAGRMTDATTGEPVGGVWIGWWTNEERDGMLGIDLENDMGFERSAPDGTYRFDLVAPGAVRLEVRGVAGQAGYLWTRRVVSVRPDRVNTVDFVLERALTVSGRVVFTDGRPGAGALIEVRQQDGERPQLERRTGDDAQPDAHGNFRVGGLRAQRYRLTARLGDDGIESEPVVVSPGATDVELRLPVPVAIAGVVLFADGSPTVGASVSIWPVDAAERRRGIRWRSEITAADGSFRFDDLRPGTYDLVIKAEGESRLSMPPKRARGVVAGTTDLSIEAERGLRLVGRALDLGGARVSNGRVRGVPVVDASEYDPLDAVSAEIIDGRFEFAGLRACEYRFVVSAEGLASTWRIVDPASREFEVRLATGGTVAGRVLLPDGKPAGRAIVSIKDDASEGSTSTQCFAAEDGTFVLAAVGPGVHRVRASEDPFLAKDEDRAERIGELAGVRVLEGEAVDGLEIRLASTGPSSSNAPSERRAARWCSDIPNPVRLSGDSTVPPFTGAGRSSC